MHFDIDNKTYCCKPYPPDDEQAQQWISQLGLPGLSEMALNLEELKTLQKLLETYQKSSDEIRHMNKLKSKLESFKSYYETLKYFAREFDVDFWKTDPGQTDSDYDKQYRETFTALEKWKSEQW